MHRINQRRRQYGLSDPLAFAFSKDDQRFLPAGCALDQQTFEHFLVVRLFLLQTDASEDGPSVVGAGLQIKHIGSTFLQLLQDGCFPGPSVAIEGHKLDLFEQYGNQIIDRAAVVFVAAFHPVDIHP